MLVRVHLRRGLFCGLWLHAPGPGSFILDKSCDMCKKESSQKQSQTARSPSSISRPAARQAGRVDTHRLALLARALNDLLRRMSGWP